MSGNRCSLAAVPGVVSFIPAWSHTFVEIDHEIIPRVILSDFIWDFGKLPFPSYLGKYFMKIGKISAKIHEIGKIKAIFGLGMTPI